MICGVIKGHFMLTEIANSIIEIEDRYLQNKCSTKNISGLRILTANTSAKFLFSLQLNVHRKLNLSKILKEQIFFNNYHRAIKAVRQGLKIEETV